MGNPDMAETEALPENLKERTAASFGFEWSRFNGIYAEYESNFLSYVYPLDRESFRGKTVLDAGCGAGRHAYFAGKYGAKVTAFDFSAAAVTAARRNMTYLSDTTDITVVQADIYNPPEDWHGKFDMVLCIGVLQHLPDPEAGFMKLAELVKPEGTLAVWVYGKKDNWLALNMFEPLRRTTTRMPHEPLLRLSWMLACGVEGMNRLRLPLFSHYAKFPFKTKWNDVFDVLSAPKSRYYTTCQVRSWFERAGMKDVVISHRMLNGKAKGIRGMGTR